MILLNLWLKDRANAGEAMGLRIQLNRGSVPLTDKMFEELPFHLQMLVVEGVVTNDRIVSDGRTFISTQLLSSRDGQRVRVILRAHKLVVEPAP